MEPSKNTYVRLNLRYYYLYDSIKNLNVINYDVINGNDISALVQSYGSNVELKNIEYGYYSI